MRYRIIYFIFIAFFTIVIARLYYWQVVRGQELKKQATGQYKSTKKIEAPRGNIFANDGSWLAVMRTDWLLYAELPKIQDDYEKISNQIAKIITEDEESAKEESLKLLKSLNRDGVVWVPLKAKITTKQKEKIESLDISGLGFEAQESRYYPEGSSSAHLLGFVGKNDTGENVGYFGLEGYYDITLSGKSGYLQREKDLSGKPFLSGSLSEAESIPGSDLYTFIDKRIQTLIENNLKLGLERYGAKEGSVIVMDPETGKIMAMASYPSFDPAKYSQYDQSLYRNPVISDSFEPGSIFKIVVMASGLDAKVIEPDTKCDICGEPLKVDKYYIKTWNNKYLKDSTMTQVLINSDNVGMSFIAQKLGQEKMYDYLDKFGVGKNTNIDLQGESSLKMRNKGSWNIVDLVTSSFGQGIAVTPIQMIRAGAAIANGGYLITPKVVDNKIKQEKIRIISEEASDETIEMMKEAAKNGEAKWTNLQGFSVAGKTGTAQIPIAGHYDAEKTIASFIGFAPAEKPKFIMLVTLKEPQSSQWASETAAPLWYSIARDLFNYFGIQPVN